MKKLKEFLKLLEMGEEVERIEKEKAIYFSKVSFEEGSGNLYGYKTNIKEKPEVKLKNLIFDGEIEVEEYTSPYYRSGYYFILSTHPFTLISKVRGWVENWGREERRDYTEVKEARRISKKEAYAFLLYYIYSSESPFSELRKKIEKEFSKFLEIGKKLGK